MDRNRQTTRDDSLFIHHTTDERGADERARDVGGDADVPTDADVIVGHDTADTMGSRQLNDPRELTPDQMTRISTDTTSTSNLTATVAGGPSGVDRHGSDALAQIREGMKVVDAGGEDLGKIDMVRMGDPEAVTTEGQEPTTTGGGIIGDLGRALTGAEGEPDVPEPLRTRLIRSGFARVDGKGWFDTDRYLTADMIDRVTGDEVHLSVTRDSIANDKGKDR